MKVAVLVGSLRRESFCRKTAKALIALAPDSLKMENSFDEPLKISPVKSEYDSFSKQFDYEFKPCSLTILRIRIAQ